MTSVNTNNAAITALRTLQQTNSAMDVTQNRVSTGLKIGEAKDNAAYWSISTTLKSDNKSLATVKDSLSLGAATVDTAYEGLNSAKDVLDELTNLVASARQDGVDRTKIQAQIKQLQDQLKSNADSAVFSGENWLSVNSSNPSLYSDNKSVVASFNRASTGAITLGTIDISIADVKLFDGNENAATRGILDTRVAMKDSTGVAMGIGGFDAVAGPSTGGLNFTGTGTGNSVSNAAGAKATLGILNMAGVTAGDKITFALTVDGSSGTVELETDGLTAANFQTKLQDAVDTAIGQNAPGSVPLKKALVAVDALTKAVTIQATTNGTASSISVGQTQVWDGAGGVKTDTAGFLTTAALPGPAFGTSEKASATLTDGANNFLVPVAAGGATAAEVSFGSFTAGATTALNDKLKFTVTYNGVTKSNIIADLGAAATKNAGDVSTAMQNAINAAFAGERINGKLYATGDIIVAADMSKISTKAVGSMESIAITNITATDSAGTGAASGGATTAFGIAVGHTSSNNNDTGSGRGTGYQIGDTFNFDVQYGSTIRRITHTFAAADFNSTTVPPGIASTWANTGVPTAAQFKDFLQAKIDAAFLSGGTGTAGASKFNGTGADYVAGDVTVATDGTEFTVTTRNAGKDQAVGVTSISGTMYGAASTLGLAANSVALHPATATGAIGYGTEAAPSLAVGTFDNANIKQNDKISLTVNVGGDEQTIDVSTDTLGNTGGTKTADANRFKVLVQTQLDAKFGLNKVKFDIVTTGGPPPSYAMTLKTIETGPDAYLAISNVTSADGNGTTTAKAGLTAVGLAGFSGNGTPDVSASTASLTSTAAFTGTRTFGANDTLTFNVTEDGNTRSVVIDRDRVDAALTPAANGVINDADDYVAVLNSAFVAAGVGLTASAPGGLNTLTFTKTSLAGTGTFSIGTPTSSGGSDTISVSEIDLTDTRFTSLSSGDQKKAIDAYLNVIDAARKKVIAAAADLGSASKRIDLQQSFVNSLIDTIDKGVGALVDADITEESTRLQALQVKQQLGVQSLSLANQGAQQILRLFQ